MPIPTGEQQPPPFERRLDVRALMILASLFGRSYQRREMRRGHACPIPRHGPAVIAANHTSGLDPLAIQSTVPRPIIWIMTSEFYDLPALKWFLAHVEMIRIDRNRRDPGAWKRANETLDRGQVVGVFPEGRIERSDELLPFHDGVATLASRARTDIYPCYLDGRQRNTPMLEAYLLPQTPLVLWGDKVGVAGADGRRRRPRDITSELGDQIGRLHKATPATRRKGRSLLS